MKKHAKEEYDQANAHKLVKKQVVWCGSGVGLIHSIEHAEDLVNNLVKETGYFVREIVHLQKTPDLGCSVRMIHSMPIWYECSAYGSLPSKAAFNLSGIGTQHYLHVSSVKCKDVS